MAKFNPAPTDLRVPLGKSVRELFLTIEYGISGTAMVAVQEDTEVSEEELTATLAYVLALQGQPIPLKDVLRGQRERSPGVDQAIYRLCATDENLSSKAIERCEEPHRKRVRTLLTGRPADISPSRYADIQSLCNGLSDLTEQNQCYRDNISLARGLRGR